LAANTLDASAVARDWAEGLQPDRMRPQKHFQYQYPDMFDGDQRKQQVGSQFHGGGPLWLFVVTGNHA